MSRSRNTVVPGAQKALERLKLETASELGLSNYQDMYKGALTSADNGRVGGQMVRKMIQSQEQQLGGASASQTGSAQTKSTLTTKFDANNRP